MRLRTTVGVVCLITASALFAACQPSQPVRAEAKEPEPLKLAAEEPVQQQAPAMVVPVKKPIVKKAVTKKAVPTKTVPTKTVAANDAPSAPIAVDAGPEITPVLESRTLPSRQDEDTIFTTISGCLERDSGMFRLKDTDGENAPKSRSWKSGFIKRSSTRIDVIDTANRLQLPVHAGHRVSVTGTLVDREMHARSVRATSDRCD